MSHYTIDYAGLSKAERHTKALQDVQDYLGENKTQDIINCIVLEIKNNGLYCAVKNVRMQLSFFAGIEGVPASELIRAAAEQIKFASMAEGWQS